MFAPMALQIDRRDLTNRVCVDLVCRGGGHLEQRCINEAGLYSLILASRKPEAKAFKRWITHEVLLAIRKTRQ
jgi:prophage antirepressor-like protein